MSEKPKVLGGMKLIEIPIIYRPYSIGLVSTEDRKHNLQYAQFEMFSKYQSETLLEIDPDKKFLELPKDDEYHFKNHSFKVKYNLQNANILSVNMEYKTSLDEITVAEYNEFKKYIESVLEKQSNLISYK